MIENKNIENEKNILVIEKGKLPVKTIKYDKKIVIVGTGAFGTAIGETLIRNDEQKNKIILFGVNSKEIDDINKNHKNSKYYSLKLSPKLYATTDAVEAFTDVDIILLAIPSLVVKTSIEKSIVPNMTKPAYFINLAKGFDYLNVDILSNVIKSTVPENLNLGTLKLTGASYASELINKNPTSFILAADDIKTSEKMYKYFANKTMKIFTSDELDAVEWLSVIKNPMAIMQGILAGLGYGVNTKALFFSQSIYEIRRMLKFLGQNENVIFSAAGIGDLYLTGTSRKSRNYSTGYAIGKANKVTKKTLQTFSTTEGLRSTEILLRISRKNKLNLKTIELLYAITYNKENPTIAIKRYLDKYQGNSSF